MSAKKTTEPVGVRSALMAACVEMERLLGRLNDSHGRVAEEVHQVRKLGKRLRGALAMCGESKQHIRSLAVIGRMMGGARDATVRVKTWESLGSGKAAEGSIDAAIGALLDLEASAANRVPPQAVVNWSLAAIGQLVNRLAERSEEEMEDAAVEGVTRLERRLRKRLKRALRTGCSDDYHACRKLVKAWVGGTSLVLPGIELPGAKVAERLADKLGDENDLEVLACWMTRCGFTPAIAEAAWKLLRQRQDRIRRRSDSLIRKELLPVIRK